jgi:hypothetical protein
MEVWSFLLAWLNFPTAKVRTEEIEKAATQHDIEASSVC